jgi:hypothetical protein
MTFTNKRSLRFAIIAVVTMLATQVVFGDEVKGFVDGLFAGFSDGV